MLRILPPSSRLSRRGLLGGPIRSFTTVFSKDEFDNAKEYSMIQRSASSTPPACRCPRVAALLVAATLAASGPASAAAKTVVLDFEGIGNDRPVGNFYGGGAGGPSKDYGVVFGTDAHAAVDSDAPGGSYGIANVPSGTTALRFWGDDVWGQSYMTVLGGFTSLSFKYASAEDTSYRVRRAGHDGGSPYNYLPSGGGQVFSLCGRERIRCVDEIHGPLLGRC